jgi:hypothetical protein
MPAIFGYSHPAPVSRSASLHLAWGHLTLRFPRRGLRSGTFTPTAVGSTAVWPALMRCAISVTLVLCRIIDGKPLHNLAMQETRCVDKSGRICPGKKTSYERLHCNSLPLSYPYPTKWDRIEKHVQHEKHVVHVFHKDSAIIFTTAACLTSTLLKTGVGANDSKCSRDQRLNVPSEARRGLSYFKVVTLFIRNLFRVRLPYLLLTRSLTVKNI